MSTQVNLPELLTEKEAAEKLGLSGLTLRNWRLEGSVEIPHFRLGNRVKYSTEDLSTFLESRKVSA